MYKYYSIPQYLFFILVAIVYIFYQSQFEISFDGALYIKQAYFFSINENKIALELHNWPFFSFIISLLQKLFSFSLINAARIINGALFLISCLYFFRILQMISNQRNVILYGFLIIVSSIPLLDDYLPMLLRDTGSWAGFLGGTYYFMRWIKTKSFFDCCLFQVGFFIGFLFRIEVLICLIFLPFLGIYLNKQSPKKYLYFFQSYIFLIIVFLISLIIINYNHELNSLFHSSINRFHEIINAPLRIIREFFYPLPIYSNNLDLTIQLNENKLITKFSLLFAIVLISWFSTVTLFHFLTAYVALKYKLISSKFNLLLLNIFSITFLIPCLFGFSSFDTSGRYWILNIWIVYIYSAVGLGFCFNYIEKFRLKNKKWLSGFLWVVMVIYLLIVFIDISPKKSYSKTLFWMQSNKIDFNAIYTNDIRIDVFSIGYNYPYQKKDIKFLVLNNNISPEYLQSKEFQHYVKTKHIKLLKNIPSNDKSDFSIYILED